MGDDYLSSSVGDDDGATAWLHVIEKTSSERAFLLTMDI